MRPLQYAVYKGTGGKYGAIQLNLQDPHFYKDRSKDFTGKEALGTDGKLADGWKTREGCIFLEMTSTKGKNVYDWDNKVVISLSVDDMGKMIVGLTTGKETKLLHDPGAKTDQQGAVTKVLSISSPNGVSEGAIFRLSKQFTKEGKEETVSHMVPVTADELVVIVQLLRAAIPRALGW